MEVNKIYTGDSKEVLKTFPDNSVNCSISSPPYWNLRDYGHEKQLGSEPHFIQYIHSLCDVYDEVYRVLKNTGTCFVNLGDTYGTGSGGGRGAGCKQKTNVGSLIVTKGLQGYNKSLCMIPERFAIEMINRGWTLRNQIIWHKPNQMPQSATDRFTVDFEKVFFFVKQPQEYYFQQIKEPSLTYENRPAGDVRDREYGYDSKQDKVRVSLGKKSFSKGSAAGKGIKPSGNATKDYYEVPFERNMRSVWSINTDPTTDAHFATYPQRLVEPMIKSGCPENGIVLDPFFGSGTTGIYARKANRNYIGIELNPQYVAIAEKRLRKELGLFY